MFRNIKKLNKFDIFLAKLSIIAFTLILLRLIPAFMDWTHNVNIWYLVILFVILGIKPCIKCCKK